jgi:hypothetical protein
MDTDIQHHPQAFQVKLRHLRVPDEDLLADLQPNGKELKRPASRFGITTYRKAFGSWHHALAAFARWKGQPVADPADLERVRVVRRPVDTCLRYAVLRRDHFRCCACGASPATNPEVELQIDHKIPWSKGGQSVMENLQTLCQKCNRGKSDSPPL